MIILKFFWADISIAKLSSVTFSIIYSFIALIFKTLKQCSPIGPRSPICMPGEGRDPGEGSLATGRGPPICDTKKDCSRQFVHLLSNMFQAL